MNKQVNTVFVNIGIQLKVMWPFFRTLNKNPTQILAIASGLQEMHLFLILGFSD